MRSKLNGFPMKQPNSHIQSQWVDNKKIFEEYQINILSGKTDHQINYDDKDD